MGKLVAFTRQARPAEAAPVPGGAKIYLFTGVRYERSGPPNTVKRSDPDKPKRRRG